MNDPADKLRLARQLITILHGVDMCDLSNVEASLDQEGNLVIRGDVIQRGSLKAVQCDVTIDRGKP